MRIIDLYEVQQPQGIPGREGIDIINGVELTGSTGYGHYPGKPYLSHLEDPTRLPAGLPRTVEYFKLTDTWVESLEGAPKISNSSVLIRGNKSLQSLKGGPLFVQSGFYFAHQNDLRDLEGAPAHIPETFTCHQNKNLSSLKGGPTSVGSDCKLNMNQSLTSLHGIGTKCFLSVRGELSIGKQVKSHALGLVLVNCKHFTLLFDGAEIIRHFIGKKTDRQREDALIDCQHALIDAGYDDLAQL